MRFVLAYVGEHFNSYYRGPEEGNFSTDINQAKIYHNFQTLMNDMLASHYFFRDRTRFNGKHLIMEVKEVPSPRWTITGRHF